MYKAQRQILKNQASTLAILSTLNDTKETQDIVKDRLDETKKLIHPDLKDEDINACDMKEDATCEVEE